jgi:protein gp37
MEADWVRSIRKQASNAGAAFFFKQWGGVRKDLTGRELDGAVFDEFPEYQFCAQ